MFHPNVGTFWVSICQHLSIVRTFFPKLSKSVTFAAAPLVLTPVARNIYVYVYVHIHLSLYVYIYIYIYVYMYTHIIHILPAARNFQGTISLSNRCPQLQAVTAWNASPTVRYPSPKKNMPSLHVLLRTSWKTYGRTKTCKRIWTNKGIHISSYTNHMCPSCMSC